MFTIDNTLKAKKRFALPAKLVSWIFHPLWMIPLLMCLFYYLFPFLLKDKLVEKEFIKLLLIVTLNTTLFSIVFIAICKGLGLISKFSMPESKDRIIPMMGIMIFYFWCNHVLGNIENVPFLVRWLVLSSFWGIILLFIANIFYKVSAHAAAAGSAVALFAIYMIISPVNMSLPFVCTVLIAGIIGTARMVIGIHTPWEIWLAFIIGVVVQVASYFYLL